MNATTSGGAAVLIALLPILPLLTIVLCSRAGKTRLRVSLALAAASLALLCAGVATAARLGLA